MEKVKYKCGFCGEEVTADQMDRNQQDIPAYCPFCEKVAWKDKDQYAVLVAEEKGIYEYDRNGDWLEYWSYFSGEGYRFIQYDMLTGNEFRDGFIPIPAADTFVDGRPIPKFLRGHYNYNCG